MIIACREKTRQPQNTSDTKIETRIRIRKRPHTMIEIVSCYLRQDFDEVPAGKFRLLSSTFSHQTVRYASRKSKQTPLVRWNTQHDR